MTSRRLLINYDGQREYLSNHNLNWRLKIILPVVICCSSIPLSYVADPFDAERKYKN